MEPSKSVDSAVLHYQSHYKVRINGAAAISILALALLGIGLLAQFKVFTLSQKSINIILVSSSVTAALAMIVLCALWQQRSKKIAEMGGAPTHIRGPSASIVGDSATPAEIEAENQRLDRARKISRRSLKAPLQPTS